MIRSKEAILALGLAALSCGPIDNPLGGKWTVEYADQAGAGSSAQPPLTEDQRRSQEAREKADKVKKILEDYLKRYPMAYRDYGMDQKSWTVVISRRAVKLYTPFEEGVTVTNFPDRSRFSVDLESWRWGEAQEVNSNILIVQENPRIGRRDYWLGILNGDDLKTVRFYSNDNDGNLEFKGQLSDEMGLPVTAPRFIAESIANSFVSNSSVAIDPLRTF